MRILNVLSPILLAITANAEDLSELVLPGDAFGADWELTQPNLLGNSASPNYINRKLAHQPVVMVNIIDLKTSEAARALWEKKFGVPEAEAIVKKVEDLPDAYDYIPPAHMKRFILMGRYWLTVEQVGDKDDRSPFIKAYYEHIMKKQNKAQMATPRKPSD